MFKRLPVRVILLVQVFFLLGFTLAAEPARLALVIGNSTYAKGLTLKNPVNDAKDLATALEKIGWRVSLAVDLDRRSFNKTIQLFRDELSKDEGSTALLYYAGHGVQVDGTNYLIPVRTEFETLDDFKTDAISMSSILTAFDDAKIGVSLIILDACRDNPFAKNATRSMAQSRGLSILPSVGGSRGSAIMFATSPGDVAQDGEGRNGVFTSALLKYLDSDLKLEDVFKKVATEVRAVTANAQTPWFNASLSSDFYFLPEAVRAERAASMAAAAEAARQAEIARATIAAATTATAQVRAEEAAKVDIARAEANAAKKAAAEAQALALKLQQDAAEKAAAEAIQPKGTAIIGGKGILNITTDPLGYSVKVDGGEPIETPVRLEVEPGAHSFEPLLSNIDGLFFAAQPPQWITVASGAEVHVPLHLTAELTTVAIRHAPPGYRVFYGATDMGVTPLPPIKVQAGRVLLHFLKEGQTAKDLYAFVEPNTEGSISWGMRPDCPAWLDTLSPRMEDKTDSWSSISPTSAWTGTSFLGVKEWGIKNLYLCRDAKYLYWRVDFNDSNPLSSLPKQISESVRLELQIWSTNNKNLRLNINMEKNRTSKERIIAREWDKAAQTNTGRFYVSITARNYRTMTIGRIPLSRLKEYGHTVHPVSIHLYGDRKFDYVIPTRLWINFGD